jgi:hypothetical protein
MEMSGHKSDLPLELEEFIQKFQSESHLESFASRLVQEYFASLKGKDSQE